MVRYLHICKYNPNRKVGAYINPASGSTCAIRISFSTTCNLFKSNQQPSFLLHRLCACLPAQYSHKKIKRRMSSLEISQQACDEHDLEHGYPHQIKLDRSFRRRLPPQHASPREDFQFANHMGPRGEPCHASPPTRRTSDDSPRLGYMILFHVATNTV